MFSHSFLIHEALIQARLLFRTPSNQIRAHLARPGSSKLKAPIQARHDRRGPVAANHHAVGAVGISYPAPRSANGRGVEEGGKIHGCMSHHGGLTVVSLMVITAFVVVPLFLG